jgi:hypothetical protein
VLTSQPALTLTAFLSPYNSSRIAFSARSQSALTLTAFLTPYNSSRIAFSARSQPALTLTAFLSPYNSSRFDFRARGVTPLSSLQPNRRLRIIRQRRPFMWLRPPFTHTDPFFPSVHGTRLAMRGGFCVVPYQHFKRYPWANQGAFFFSASTLTPQQPYTRLRPPSLATQQPPYLWSDDPNKTKTKTKTATKQNS